MTVIVMSSKEQSVKVVTISRVSRSAARTQSAGTLGVSGKSAPKDKHKKRAKSVSKSKTSTNTSSYESCNSENSIGSLAKPKVISAKEPLEQQPYWHGNLPREDICALLKQKGDFMVRKTRKSDKDFLVISLLWDQPRHFEIHTTTSGLFYLAEDTTFQSVAELILYYWSQKIPVTKSTNAVLLKPVSREYWELSHDMIKFGPKLGSGNFGDVFKGFIMLPDDQKVPCAIKTCRTCLPEAEKRNLLREARIMRLYKHKNIVRLYGVCVQKDPTMIIMELVSGGGLDDYLKKQKGAVSTVEKLMFCTDSARGMAYLEKKGCIHRDLAARNCLLTKYKTIKLSDFGMSREGGSYQVEKPTILPVKWTAPEAMNEGKYSSKSDVWSFGVLIWEIFSDAAEPYPGLTNKETRMRIEIGYRMPAPPGMSRELEAVMKDCWKFKPLERPNFKQLKHKLRKLCTGLPIDQTTTTTTDSDFKSPNN